MASQSAPEDYYAVLGLARDCSSSEIRAAYRILARRYHPDLNPEDPESLRRAQTLNAAHEVLSDPTRRRAYDRELDRASEAAAGKRAAKIERNIKQEVRLRAADFIRGIALDVRVKDPAEPNETGSYRLEIPPLTPPRARLRVPRQGAAGDLQFELKVLPDVRFKVRGSDVQTDLRISAQRAAQGGTEMIQRPEGGMLRVSIPARAKRGEIVRVPGAGMPRPRGGRGDLLVRLTYRPEVRVSRVR